MADAENRQKCGLLMEKIGVRMPEWAAATSAAEVVECAERIGYPVLVRPSFVLGGRGMEIIHNRQQLDTYLRLETHASPERPVLVDRFLEGALELDVDLVSDGERVLVGAIMEQIEMAGVHSGDSACTLPPALPMHRAIAPLKPLKPGPCRSSAPISVKQLTCPGNSWLMKVM